MRGALLILKKEFLELSKDRRTLFFTFIMPHMSGGAAMNPTASMAGAAGAAGGVRTEPLPPPQP